jgi:hypothetical protein
MSFPLPRSDLEAILFPAGFVRPGFPAETGAVIDMFFCSYVYISTLSAIVNRHQKKFRLSWRDFSEDLPDRRRILSGTPARYKAAADGTIPKSAVMTYSFPAQPSESCAHKDLRKKRIS